MGLISNFEGQTQIRNLLNNESYDQEKTEQYLNENIEMSQSPELHYDTNRYINTQQSKICEVDDIYSSKKLSPELKKVLMCEKLPFRTNTKDLARYHLIQLYLNKILYKNKIFDIYDNVKCFNAIQESAIQKVKDYFVNNKIYLDDDLFLENMFCNYGNPYKNPDGLIHDFVNIDGLSDKEKNLVVGRYAELEIYNMLRENLKPEEEIKWVSKDVGDLFGYDIIINNVLTQKVKLVEVKSSYKNGGELTLSENEYNKLQESIQNGNEYEMYKLEYVNGQRNLYKITHDDGDYYEVQNLCTGARGRLFFQKSKFDKTKNILSLNFVDIFAKSYRYIFGKEQ